MECLSFSECPDGLLCTSTIPSHYKRYTHFLLAQSRASRSPPSSPWRPAAGTFSQTDPGLPCSLEGKWSLCQKPTEDLKNFLATPSQVTPACLRKGLPSTEISTLMNSATSQEVPPLTEHVNNDKLGVRESLCLAEELDNQQIHVSLPENDESNDGISYSPLLSDEESDGITVVNDSQQELIFTQISKDDSLGEDDRSLLLKNCPCPLILSQEENHPEVKSLFIQNECSNGLPKYSTHRDSSPLLFQSESLSSCPDPADMEEDVLSLPAALVRGLSSYYQDTQEKFAEPEFQSSQSNKQKQLTEVAADDNQLSLPLLKGEMLKGSESQRGGGLAFPLTQSRVREVPSQPFNARNSTTASTCSCRKAPDRVPSKKGPALNRETFPSTPPASKSLQTVSSGSKCKAAASSSTKAMKQMDIGVYFGLPPKKKEEQVPGDSVFEGKNSNPVVSPRKKGSQQHKRKAEKSLSDVESDGKTLNESCLELSSQRSQRPRKRWKRSDSVQGRNSQKTDLMNKTELKAVHLSQDKALIKSTGGRIQKRNMKAPESYNAGELRKRTCPFYKKIPGKLNY